MTSSYIPKKLRERVAAQARHRCGYCLSSEAIVGLAMEIEHLTLLKLTDRAEKEGSSQLGELRPHRLVAAARGGTLVEEPTPYRHISSDASTATSTRRLNCFR
jgi:hypothetical protein